MKPKQRGPIYLSQLAEYLGTEPPILRAIAASIGIVLEPVELHYTDTRPRSGAHARRSRPLTPSEASQLISHLRGIQGSKRTRR